MNNDIPYEEKYLKTSLLFQKDDNNTTLLTRKEKKTSLILVVGVWQQRSAVYNAERYAAWHPVYKIFCINLFF